jgi:hypothetical protein
MSAYRHRRLRKNPIKPARPAHAIQATAAKPIVAAAMKLDLESGKR